MKGGLGGGRDLLEENTQREEIFGCMGLFIHLFLSLVGGLEDGVIGIRRFLHREWIALSCTA